MIQKKIRVEISGEESETAYIYLPGHPEEPQPGIVKKMICLDDVIEEFKGPRVNLDFSEDGVLIGIEVLA